MTPPETTGRETTRQSGDRCVARLSARAHIEAATAKNPLPSLLDLLSETCFFSPLPRRAATIMTALGGPKDARSSAPENGAAEAPAASDSARLDERAQRIVATAVELAEKGGFEAVRLRDVAATAGVALGTLYRHFSSKEDLLVAALTEQIGLLERRMEAQPASGETPAERVSSFFATATNGLCRRPMLAKAMLRATTSGLPELTEKVASFHGRMTGMIAQAIQGPAPSDRSGQALMEESLRERSFLLTQVWFASLVGWSGGVHDQAKAVEQVRSAAAIILPN